MPAMTIRNLSEETHRALKARAARNGRSTEAELCAILEAAVRLPDRVHVGTALSAFGRSVGLTNADVETLENTRDKTPAVPVNVG